MRRSITLWLSLLALAASGSCKKKKEKGDPAPPAPIRKPTKPPKKKPPTDHRWRNKPPTPGPAKPIVAPGVERYQLPNGLTVLVVSRRRFPLVQLRLVIRAGAYEDPKGKAGLADLTADLLNEGAGNLSALAISERAGQLGSSIASGASTDETAVSIGVLKRNWQAALALLATVSLEPTFPPAEIARRKAQITRYLERLPERPRAVAAILIGKVLFGADHPNGRPDSGTIASLRQLTRNDLQGFYRRFYRPDNAALVLVGDIGWKEAQGPVTKAFGGWKKPAVPLAGTPIRKATPDRGRLFVVDRPGAPQSALRVGESGPPRRHPDFVALMVMNNILGGAFTSRINMNLRERNGFTYGAGSGFAFDRRPAAFTIRTAVKTSTTGPALKEIFNELEGMTKTPPSDEEIATAKAFLSTSVTGWFVTNEGVSGAVGRLFTHQLPLDFWSRFPERVKAITAKDIARVTRTHLHPNQMKVVVVGDLAKIKPSLAKLGLGSLTQLSGIRGQVVKK